MTVVFCLGLDEISVYIWIFMVSGDCPRVFKLNSADVSLMILTGIVYVRVS